MVNYHVNKATKGYLLVLMLVLLFTGCAVYRPVPIGKLNFKQRAISKTQDGLTVSVVALSAEESKQAFGADMADEGMQPVWIRIENTRDKGYLLLENRVDSNYYSPHEAAWKSHYFASAKANIAMDQYFLDMHMRVYIPPQSTVSGFIYTNIDEGIKYIDVELLGKGEFKDFWFVAEVPGLQADYKRVDWYGIYAQDEISDFQEEAELRNWLQALPCCVHGGDRETFGDPLNLIVIGNKGMVLPGFVSRDWDLTETMHGGAVWGTIKSSLFGSRYRTSPVSPLYLFGRSQDIALQKARSTVDERNHLRLWLAPVKFLGMNVFVGQISRDIGVRMSSKTFVTHKIDPAVDEARTYLGLDLIVSGRVQAYGYVKGVGSATFNTPRYNYTKDPYYTDGNRLVLVMADRYTDILNIERLDWVPPLIGN